MEPTPRRTAAPVAALALALPLTLGTLPAGAAPSTFVYDALGDSYAAGFGVAPGQAYPFVLDGRMRIELDDQAAVNGARLRDLPAQLTALGPGTDLVTLSIGGNDVGWGTAVGGCVTGTDLQCTQALGLSLLLVQALPGALDQAYAGVRAAAPGAHVVVTGYPRLFSPEHGPYLNASPEEQVRLNAAADQLNAVLAAAAARAGFQFVDVTDRFVGHGVNAPDAWIGGIGDPELFHPTVEGQHAYGVALRSAIRPSDLR